MVRAVCAALLNPEEIASLIVFIPPLYCTSQMQECWINNKSWAAEWQDSNVACLHAGFAERPLNGFFPSINSFYYCFCIILWCLFHGCECVVPVLSKLIDLCPIGLFGNPSVHTVFIIVLYYYYSSWEAVFMSASWQHLCPNSQCFPVPFTQKQDLKKTPQIWHKRPLEGWTD